MRSGGCQDNEVPVEFEQHREIHSCQGKKKNKTTQKTQIKNVLLPYANFANSAAVAAS